jgi:hypothetical protein
MEGENSGVQKKKNFKSKYIGIFMPLGCHDLNLVLRDAAKLSVTLFGVLRRLYSLFVASVNRSKILTDHVKPFALKQLTDTRWEAKIASVKALR